METRERYRGCLIGLAVGDALGTAVEFKARGSFAPVTDMLGGGPFKLRPGEWTDDTSMALCLAESLVKKRKFDPLDQMERYTKWWKFGHLSSNGRCFDIGHTVLSALRQFRIDREPLNGSTSSDSAGNGSIMRLAPVPMYFRDNPRDAVRLSGESSRTTHGARACIDACRFLGGLLVGALNGTGKERLLTPFYSPVQGLWEEEPLCPEIAGIAGGDYRAKGEGDISGRGYVVSTLEAALWALDKATNFDEGCLLVVNLGDDADTTAAVYGQLAGALYGEGGIPPSWREKISRLDVIRSYADRLFNQSEGATVS